MTDNTRQIIYHFAQDTKKLMGSSLRKIILYGSYARGDNRNNSDVDIMVLTTLQGIDIEEAETWLFDLAFDYEMEYGLIINPLLQNEEHFNYWLGAYTFYDNVQKEGVLIG